MKTNRMFTVVRLVVLGVLVAGFNAKLASAQTFQGKFTLASTASWGSARLLAGDYSFILDKGTVDSKVTVYRGKNAVAMIPTNAIDQTTSGSCELVLEGGTVREARLPLIGLTLVYLAHNPGHRAAPQEPLAAQVIPVAATHAGR
jgi:hypothetical protein